MLEFDESLRVGVEAIETDDICAVLVERRSGAGDPTIHGNKRLVAIITGPTQTDEYIIVAMRVNEDCKTNGSPS